MANVAPKMFDSLGSRGRITKVRDEVARIRRRIKKLDTNLVSEFNARIREVDSALLHLKEYADMVVEVRSIRGDD